MGSLPCPAPGQLTIFWFLGSMFTSFTHISLSLPSWEEVLRCYILEGIFSLLSLVMWDRTYKAIISILSSNQWLHLVLPVFVGYPFLFDCPAVLFWLQKKLELWLLQPFPPPFFFLNGSVDCHLTKHESLKFTRFK